MLTLAWKSKDIEAKARDQTSKPGDPRLGGKRPVSIEVEGHWLVAKIRG